MDYKTVIVEKIIANPNDKVNPPEVVEVNVKSGIVTISYDNPAPFKVLRANLFEITGFTLDITFDEHNKTYYPIHSKFMDNNEPMKVVDNLNKALQELSLYPNPDMDIEVQLDKDGNQLSATISIQKNMHMWTSM